MKPIVDSEPLKKKKLECIENGFRYSEPGVFGMGEGGQHAFHEIDAIVRDSHPAVLHIQVGRTIYSVRYKANDANHRAVIDCIVAGAKAAH